MKKKTAFFVLAIMDFMDLDRFGQIWNHKSMFHP